MRLLVAEDERITRASLVRQLQAWGHEVVAAEDGEQAWELFGKGGFDIVLTDWEMPRLSGLELIQKIRAASKGFVYLIMLTGRSDKSDLVKGIESGADDFVSKPFDKEELRVRVLSGERVVKLERTLIDQNAELRAAGDRMRKDLEAAARVQRAMLPKANVATAHARAAWKYVPTDELAGDAIGLHMIGGRHLVAYVIDVSGHGVPAALLSVTAMHAMSPAVQAEALVKSPAGVLAELNRRFCAADNDGRFLTMILCVLDTQTGLLRFSRAGHPLPIVLRGGATVEVNDEGGFPLAMVDGGEYGDVSVQLSAGDRFYLYSDGIIEQPGKDGKLFREERLLASLKAQARAPGEQVVETVVSELAEWAGKRSFVDDVSLVVADWIG